MTKDKFLRGAMILTLAGLMVKIIGSVNRILLSRLLGGEGIGLYQMAYPVYLLMLSISSAGIPIAISIIVAEKVAKGDFASASRIFRVSLGLMAVTGLVFASGLYFAAGWLVDSGLVRDPRAYYGLVALTPAVFFCDDPGQLPWLFSRLSDDDASGCFADIGAVCAGCDHGSAGLLPAAAGFGICGCRRGVRRCARLHNRIDCFKLLLLEEENALAA